MADTLRILPQAAERRSGISLCLLPVEETPTTSILPRSKAVTTGKAHSRPPTRLAQPFRTRQKINCASVSCLPRPSGHSAERNPRGGALTMDTEASTSVLGRKIDSVQVHERVTGFATHAKEPRASAEKTTPPTVIQIQASAYVLPPCGEWPEAEAGKEVGEKRVLLRAHQTGRRRSAETDSARL